MNIKKFKKVILISSILALVFSVISFWTYNYDWVSLLFLIFQGIVMILIQKEARAYKFISSLLVGSIYYSFLSLLFNDLRDYAISNIFFHSGMPFMVIYDFKVYCILSLSYAFICFMSGLIAVVVKGFWKMYKDR